MRLFELERLEQDLTELQEIGLARRGRTPSQPDIALRLRLDEAQEFHALVAHLDVDRDFGQQCHAVAACHHLQDGRQAGRPEPVMSVVALAAID